MQQTPVLERCVVKLVFVVFILVLLLRFGTGVEADVGFGVREVLSVCLVDFRNMQVTLQAFKLVCFCRFGLINLLAQLLC
ncbi:unnamed protein product [Fusarium graminearum]|nr:unnamed protein product [Fusarium graminearum]CAG1971544.1 unnamed protein product [Fusarium graminearum]VTO85536.1 unnamed protein product [Fusarium graminearum]